MLLRWPGGYRYSLPLSVRPNNTLRMESLADKMLLTLPDFMASVHGRKADSARPRPLHVSKSFSRDPVSPGSTTRIKRASTVQNGLIPEIVTSDRSEMSMGKERLREEPDAFEKASEDGADVGAMTESTGKLPVDFDELPIELVGLTDRSVPSRFMNPKC